MGPQGPVLTTASSPDEPTAPRFISTFSSEASVLLPSAGGPAGVRVREEPRSCLGPICPEVTFASQARRCPQGSLRDAQLQMGSRSWGPTLRGTERGETGVCPQTESSVPSTRM